MTEKEEESRDDVSLDLTEIENTTHYYYNAESPRVIEDAACNKLLKALYTGSHKRREFCKMLLLPDQSAPTTQWTSSELSGPVCMSVLHQQLTPGESGNRLWILLGDQYVNAGVRCNSSSSIS